MDRGNCLSANWITVGSAAINLLLLLNIITLALHNIMPLNVFKWELPCYMYLIVIKLVMLL